MVEALGAVSVDSVRNLCTAHGYPVTFGELQSDGVKFWNVTSSCSVDVSKLAVRYQAKMRGHIDPLGKFSGTTIALVDINRDNGSASLKIKIKTTGGNRNRMRELSQLLDQEEFSGTCTKDNKPFAESEKLVWCATISSHTRHIPFP
jgi:hypothetical protein